MQFGIERSETPEEEVTSSVDLPIGYRADVSASHTSKADKPRNAFDGVLEAYRRAQCKELLRRGQWTPDDPEIIDEAQRFRYSLTMSRVEVAERMTPEQRWRALLGWGWITCESPEYELGEVLLSWGFDHWSPRRRDAYPLLAAPVESRVVGTEIAESRTITFLLEPSSTHETRYVLADVASKLGDLSKAKRGYRCHLQHEAHHLAAVRGALVPSGSHFYYERTAPAE